MRNRGKGIGWQLKVTWNPGWKEKIKEQKNGVFGDDDDGDDDGHDDDDDDDEDPSILQTYLVTCYMWVFSKGLFLMSIMS